MENISQPHGACYAIERLSQQVEGFILFRGDLWEVLTSTTLVRDPSKSLNILHEPLLRFGSLFPWVSTDLRTLQYRPRAHGPILLTSVNHSVPSVQPCWILICVESFGFSEISHHRHSGIAKILCTTGVTSFMYSIGNLRSVANSEMEAETTSSFWDCLHRDRTGSS